MEYFHGRGAGRPSRQSAAETSIWVGGPEVSYDAGDVLKRNPAIDLVMCGEGEETFRELVEAAAKQFPLEGELLSDIAGIVFRGRDGRITDTGAGRLYLWICCHFLIKIWSFLKQDHLL